MMLFEHEYELVVAKGAHFIIGISYYVLFMHEGKIMEASDSLQIGIQDGVINRRIHN